MLLMKFHEEHFLKINRYEVTPHTYTTTYKEKSRRINLSLCRRAVAQAIYLISHIIFNSLLDRKYFFMCN